MLSRTPPPLSMPPLQNLTGRSAHELKEELLSLLRKKFERADNSQQRAKQSYKEQFDSRVRPRKLPPIGSYVYVRRHVTDKRTPESARQVKSNKLRYRVNGPYEVINNSKETNVVTILKEGLEDTVSADHIVPSTRFSELRPALPPQIQSDDNNQHLSRYVFDKIVNHGMDPDDNQVMMYKVRWHGYDSSHDTWQYAKDLSYNTVVRYSRRWNIPIPPRPRTILTRINRTPN